VGCVWGASSNIIKDLISPINCGFPKEKPLEKSYLQSPIIWNSKTQNM
jgi:hypothetical protein